MDTYAKTQFLQCNATNRNVCTNLSQRVPVKCVNITTDAFRSKELLLLFTCVCIHCLLSCICQCSRGRAGGRQRWPSYIVVIATITTSTASVRSYREASTSIRCVLGLWQPWQWCYTCVYLQRRFSRLVSAVPVVIVIVVLGAVIPVFSSR
jgi:hypothetical protein